MLIPTDTKEAVAAARDILQNNLFGSAGAEIVIEQFLEGQEVSVLAFCDGKLAVGMPPAQVLIQVKSYLVLLIVFGLGSQASQGRG